MKAIRTIFFLLVLSLVSCSDDDTSKKEIQTCETEDLGITEEYRNPLPEYDWAYIDWKWTILNDTVLRIKTGENNFGQFFCEYYYFNINKEKQCLSFQKARHIFPDDVQPDNEENEEVTPYESSDYTFKLQYWSENDRFIGKIIPNNPIYAETEQKIFWVELNNQNYEAQTEEEDYLGL